MAAIRNPYGAGDSGDLLTDRKNKCACCQGWFVFRGHPRMRERWPKRCPQCQGHRLDGSAQDVIVALTEHAERFHALADRAYAMTAEAKAVASKLDERNKYLNDELRSATSGPRCESR